MYVFEFIVKNGSDLISFISPIVGVIASAFIAWVTYRKQVVEKEIKANVATFSYLLSLIIKNFEELHNIKEQISAPALEEVNNFLDTLYKIEEYIDWAVNDGKPPVYIIIKDKVAYAKQQVAKLSKKLVLSVATRQHFTYIDAANFQKETALLTQFGDLCFGTVCNRLDTQYNVIIDIQESIKQYNEENIGIPRSMFNEYKIISNDETYKADINNYRGQILYRKSLIESYDTTVTRCLMTSYNAACHLESFFHHYLKKHCIVIKKLGIPYKAFEFDDDSFFENDKFQLYLESVQPHEYRLFSVPLYKNLKRNFWDRLTDFIFYFEWK